MISAVTPIKNIPNYPDIDSVLAEINALPRKVLVDADALAREAGNVRAANIVLVGVASRFLPLKEENLKNAIRELFARKGEALVDINLKAFEYGRNYNS